MIASCEIALPHGTTLACRVSGEPHRPVLLFLHGFPEGAFIWDAQLAHFSRPEHGGYYCVAPYLRGFGGSSSPPDAEAYRPRHLVQDIDALIAQLCPDGAVECLIAHDWGGAVAWNLANQKPDCMRRLMIVNSPHPGAFVRELQHSAAQQAASQYMHFLRRDDAETLLAEDDFHRLFGFFSNTASEPPAWLTEAERAKYRALWQQGLRGACNYYRATPLRPPRAGDAGAQTVQMPDSMCTIEVPTRVLWGSDDFALLPSLLEGLEAWIPDLDIRQIPGASHWLVHEQPDRVNVELTDFLQSKR
jgi:pimeloyl-ACP methyl ester carboxylesterase